MTRRQDDSHPGTADRVPVLTGGSDIGETEATEPFPAEVPAAGSDVSLLQADDPGVAILGTLISWSASPTLLVITATVELDDPLDAALVRARVWVSARTESGTLVVVTALANCSAGSRIVDLTGVQALAGEPRRRAAKPSVSRSGRSAEAAVSRSRGQEARSRLRLRRRRADRNTNNVSTPPTIATRSHRTTRSPPYA